MNQMKMLTAILLVFSVLWSVVAQQPKNETTGRLEIPPRACEFNNMVLRNASIEAGPDTIILLISRPGEKDTLLDLGKKRLHTARTYLVEYTKLRTPENVKIAEASDDGSLFYGGVEIYVKGDLFDVLTVNANQILDLGSCSSPQSDDKESRARRALLFPWIYKTKSTIKKPKRE